MRIALAGNPNSGKTTMYNALTGSNEKIGNWAGVTVDKKEHLIKKTYYDGDQELYIVDLPGAYSMSPFTSEESITSHYVNEENPDIIINIVDSTNLSRSLFFTTQLLELGIPVIVALNKSDLTEKKETHINVKLLSELLKCPVVETISTSSDGLKMVVSEALNLKGNIQEAPLKQNDLYNASREEVVKADKERFAFVNNIVNKVEKRKVHTNERNFQDKIDDILINKWFGIPIFAIVMFLVFWISQVGPGVWISDLLTGWLESFKEWVTNIVSIEGELNIWGSILVDGIIGGVIAVIGFLPLVMVMYFLIALLEDCGYMARVSVVLDPIFKKVGLSGKSVIPFVIGTGCAVPGVMACRTIRDERERRATAMLAPFMPCGAKLPVIALFAGAFFSSSTWVGPLMYFLGIVIIFFCALLINKLTGCKHKNTYFIMELPEYKVPSFIRACGSMISRGWSYIVKAGTVILVCNFAIHVMQTFNWKFEIVNANESILHDIATPFAFVLAPIIGVTLWQLAAAAITGFIAKENVVGTLAVCFVGLDNFIDTEELAILEGSGAEVAGIIAITKVAALAYLMFNLFSPPCFAAIGAMNAEMKSKKWLWSGIGLQLGVGYTVGFLTFFFGTLFTTGDFGSAWMPILGWAVVLVFALILTILIIKKNKELKAN